MNPIKVLDLSHRLPGPLATHVLQATGAQVTKVEDITFGDPFKDGFFKEMDPSFSNWYEELNKGKNLVTLDFKDPKSIPDMERLIGENDIILNALPSKIAEKFGLKEETLKEKFQEKVFLKMVGSKKEKAGMHDLNVLARLGLLELFLHDKPLGSIQAPPFLPFGGISFGAYLSSQALASLLKARTQKKCVFETVSLEESVEILLKPFFSHQLQKTGQRGFLHNGRYPCYNLYPLKGKGFLAVAALEPKYWQRFCEELDLGLSDSQRFDFKTPQVFEEIKEKTLELTPEAAKELFQNKDCCVDIVALS